MITGRPYRDPFTSAEALAELHRCGGAQFDPRVVSEFARVLSETPETERGAARAGSEWKRDVVR
jgi:HD-GYP domain-containing protein (c-di-GMP phosphodiesterase class II)